MKPTLEEAKQKYPIGTTFNVAHLTNDPKYQFTIEKGDIYQYYGDNICISRNGSTNHPISGVTLLLEINNNWATIISQPIKINSIPDRWFVAVTKESLSLVNKYRAIKNYRALKVGNWKYITQGSDGVDTVRSNIITFEEFKLYCKSIGITEEIIEDVNPKYIPNPIPKEFSTVNVRCIKDCTGYKIGDITWVTNSYIMCNKLNNCIHPENNKHHENYYDCFELVKPIIIDSCVEIPLDIESVSDDLKDIEEEFQEKLSEKWFLKITHENLYLVNRYRKYKNYDEYTGIYINDIIDESSGYVCPSTNFTKDCISDTKFINILSDLGIDILSNNFPVGALKERLSEITYGKSLNTPSKRYLGVDLDASHGKLDYGSFDNEPKKKKTTQVELIPVKQRRII